MTANAPQTASRDPSSHERRVALVTGGAMRVGRATCLALASAGYDVALTYRTSRDDAEATARDVERHGVGALTIQVDLADRDADAQVHEQLTTRFGRLDALVNNAAIFWPTEWGAVDAEAYDRFQAVNARAPLMLMQRFGSMLGARFDANEPASAGRVVNFVDLHVLGEPMVRHAAYNASKAALLELTRSAAVEMGPAVTVNAVAPGVVAWASDMSESYRKRYLERTPLARAGTPVDAAAAVRWLVCEAHYCTGEVIRIDGGRGLR